MQLLGLHPFACKVVLQITTPPPVGWQPSNRKLCLIWLTQLTFPRRFEVIVNDL